MVDANPSPWRAGLCVVLAVGLALTVGLSLARTDYRYKSTGAGSWGWSCGTDSSLKVKGLPGVCLGAPWCNQSQCCPPANGRVVWYDPMPSDDTGGLIPPDVLEPRWEYDATLTANVDLITVWCSINDANLPFYIIKLRCDTAAWGRFDKGGRFFSDNNILNIQIGSTNTSLKTGDSYGQIEVQLGLGVWWQFPRQVDMEYYPDFKLPFSLWFAARWDKESNPNQKNLTAEQKRVYDSEPPVVVQLNFNYIPNFEVTDPGCKFTKEPDGTHAYGLEGLVQLSKAARVGVDTLNACMWTLAILSCAMSFLWCMLAKPRDHVHVDLMCFSGALLFAIPTMRTLLPAAPAAGTRYDVLNVYGQLLLVTIAIGLQFFKMLFALVHLERLRLHGLAVANDHAKSVISIWVHRLTRGGPPSQGNGGHNAAAPPAVQALAQAIAAAIAANPAAAAALGPAPAAAAAAAAPGAAQAAAAPHGPVQAAGAPHGPAQPAAAPPGPAQAVGAPPGPAPAAAAPLGPAQAAAAPHGLAHAAGAAHGLAQAAGAAPPGQAPAAGGAPPAATALAATPNAAPAGGAAAARLASATAAAARAASSAGTAPYGAASRPNAAASAAPHDASSTAAAASGSTPAPAGTAVPPAAAAASDLDATLTHPATADAPSSTGSKYATRRQQQQQVELAQVVPPAKPTSSRRPWLPRVYSPPQRGRQAPQQGQDQQQQEDDQQQQQQQQVADADSIQRDQEQRPTRSTSSVGPSGIRSPNDGA